LKFCIAPAEAEKRRESNKDHLTTIERKRPIGILHIVVPISDELKEQDKEFERQINK